MISEKDFATKQGNPAVEQVRYGARRSLRGKKKYQNLSL